MTTNTIVPDTSVIIDGNISSLVEQGELDGATVLIPEALMHELEHQANEGREIGEAGLKEVRRLQKAADDGEIELEFVGRKPTHDEIDHAAEGGVDALIRSIAEENDAKLYTADRVQALVASSKNIPHKFFRQHDERQGLPVTKYFEEGTMSVHLKEGMVPKAKKGEPGDMEYVPIDQEILTHAEVEKIAHETFEFGKRSNDGLVELDKEGATVLQIDDYRVAITRPPFSEKTEITAVRPTVKVSLDDYDLSADFRKRLQEQAEGIMIAGAPGHGKSTFAQSLAEYYEHNDMVVKTMEHPRDLDVGPGITQYSALEDEMENTGDLLLLVRPDYTVFDEVRQTEDFEVFADMRLAGVGMIGVVHASDALDAVQRLIGRVEMGVIPQVVDTVVYIENASVEKVYSLELTVKVPAGMQEADLARPVVLVKDFADDSVEYEIYTYGEETAIIPVDEVAEDDGSPTQELAKQQLKHVLRQYAKDPRITFDAENAVTVAVEDDEIPRLIGSNGETISRIEDEVGLSITVEEKDEQKLKEEVACDIAETEEAVRISVDESLAGETVQVFDRNSHVMTATVGKGGSVTVTKDSSAAKKVLGAASAGRLSVYRDAS